MKFTKKPQTIEAERLTKANLVNVLTLLGGEVTPDGTGITFNTVKCPTFTLRNDDDYFSIEIHTLEGDMTLTEGNWLIKGIKGEFYPCRHDIFLETYERTTGG